ncbi:MAG: hypothetical protein HF312_02640 [Ignavibacteria bacterium]|jgi:predicted DNA-binding protein|nr:hypothetical protein [Ignavibacteria bacterium]MCU7519083.1 hypothetical protein [Ignavibacteria bacterium]
MYSPKISNEKLLKKLYQLKQTKKKPITELVQEAIEQYIQREEDKSKGGPK